jgi:hypothetical protein
MELFLVVCSVYRVFIVSRRYQQSHPGEQAGQGFSKVLFPAFDRREERKLGRPTSRLGTAVPKHPDFHLSKS